MKYKLLHIGFIQIWSFQARETAQPFTERCSTTWTLRLRKWLYWSFACCRGDTGCLLLSMSSSAFRLYHSLCQPQQYSHSEAQIKSYTGIWKQESHHHNSFKIPLLPVMKDTKRWLNVSLGAVFLGAALLVGNLFFSWEFFLSSPASSCLSQTRVGVSANTC